MSLHSRAETPKTRVDVVKLSLSGLYCAGCLPAVEKSLTAIEGVVSAKATFEPPRAVVRFDARKTTVKALIAAVAKAGYTAKQVGDGGDTKGS